jgi:hypothetical protein
VITNSQEEVIDKFGALTSDDPQNTIPQFVSTLKGLEEIKTPYVLKTRCDYYFEVIDKVFERHSREKIISLPMFIRNSYWHFSDILYLASTEKVKTVYTILANPKTWRKRICAEITFWYTYADLFIEDKLPSKDDPDYLPRYKAIVGKYFDIIPLYEIFLKEFNFKGQRSPHVWADYCKTLDEVLGMYYPLRKKFVREINELLRRFHRDSGYFRSSHCRCAVPQQQSHPANIYDDF